MTGLHRLYAVVEQGDPFRFPDPAATAYRFVELVDATWTYAVYQSDPPHTTLPGYVRNCPEKCAWIARTTGSASAPADVRQWPSREAAAKWGLVALATAAMWLAMALLAVLVVVALVRGLARLSPDDFQPRRKTTVMRPYKTILVAVLALALVVPAFSLTVSAVSLTAHALAQTAADPHVLPVQASPASPELMGQDKIDQHMQAAQYALMQKMFLLQAEQAAIMTAAAQQAATRDMIAAERQATADQTGTAQ